MKIIEVNGYKIQVDDEDYEFLSKLPWRVVWKDNCYYAQLQPTLMHRLILNDHPIKIIDHVDGDGLNNQRSNLRPSSHSKNEGNSRKQPYWGGNPCSSKYKGVCFIKKAKYTKKLWSASIGFHRHVTHIGTYESELEAAKAYDAKAIECWGPHARTNKMIYPEDF